MLATVTLNRRNTRQVDIDTGARTSLVLNKQFHESNKISEGVPSIEAVWGLGVGGHTKSRLGRVQQFAMGDQKLPDVLTSFTQDVSGAFANPDLAGNIGGEILRRFTVTFDYSRKQMLLEPNSNFAQPFRFDMSGLNLTAGPEFSIIRVNKVIAASPAAEAGGRKGRLISINDRPASAYPLEQCDRI